jgi:hypothetical protein
MTREDIIRMAREAYGDWYPNAVSHELERFANLVATHEREACAQILDRNVALCGTNLMMRDVLAGNALAIRARGEP